MAKKRSVILRLALIPALIFLLFLGIVRMPSLFRKVNRQKVTQEVRSFGIILPEGYQVLGIDVSNHQEKINWESVDSMTDKNHKISFVFVKATEGITRQDPSFKRNWQGLKKTNLIRGAYHFYYPSRDASKQAKNFIRQVHLVQGDLPPVIDIEHTSGRSKTQIIKGLKVFLSAIEDHYKVKPIIYTNHSFYTDYLQGSFDEYPLWISFYNGHKRFKQACTYNWHFWQHSDKGKVSGISGPVDFNVFYGSMNELHSLCIE